MTIRISAYKSISPSEYTATPFRTYASHNYIYTSGSTANSEDVNILLGEKFDTASQGLRTENSTYELFDSVVQTFYSPVPYAMYGILSSSYHPTGSVFVVSITQDIFGEEIKQGTLNISIGTSSSFDDSYGNLIISESGVGYTIGQVFYDKGIAIIKPTGSIVGGGLTKNGICIVNGTNVQVQFTSSVMLVEHRFKVKLNPTDFLYSVHNPSVSNQTIVGLPKTALELMTSQSLYPYITSIGLYNQDNELLAVAKISKPIQRTDYSVQTFIVKFDT